MVVISEVLQNAKRVNENAKKTVKNSNGLMHLEKITSDVTKIFVDLKEHLETLSWEQELLTWDEKKLKSNFPPKPLLSNTPSVASTCNKGNKSQTNSTSKLQNPGQNTQVSQKRATSPTQSSVAPNQSKSPSGKSQTAVPMYPKPKSTPNDQLQVFKNIVNNAKKDRKTFTVCGNFQSIRRSLLSRGWVEKIRIYPVTFDKEFWRNLENKTIFELVDGVNHREYGYAYKRMILSKLLDNCQVDFFWDTANDAFKINNDKVKFTLINRFRRNVFTYTSKQGLCEGAKTAYWYQRTGVSQIRHPRAYSLDNEDGINEFVENYRITAAISLLKWILHTYEKGVMNLISPAGKVSIWTFHFAMSECRKYEMTLSHQDIDEPVTEAKDYEWDRFLQCFYQLVHVTNHFKKNLSVDSLNQEAMVFKARIMLNKIKGFNPHMDMDGMLNMWILKPTFGSRGVGINVCQTLDFILKSVKENKSRKYVVQKYIEKPLLIYKTKFDIRQWFLISSTLPLTIWMYKTCYLRFSSQTYNLRKLHRAIHLTNNSVQAQFKCVDRDKELPEDNMWDLPRFKKHLISIGHANVWNNVIYPGMKECITASILMNQENLDYRRNSFELYGADFMLTEDFIPWLIEINSRPALYASTKVTGRLCPMVLEDMVKVIIDRSRNANAPVGNFELLYKEKANIYPVNAKENLTLTGTPVPKHFFDPPPQNFSSELSSTKSTIKGSMSSAKGSSAMSTQKTGVETSINSAKQAIQAVGKEMKSTLQMLLGVIEKEKRKREDEYKNETKVSGNQSGNNANAASTSKPSTPSAKSVAINNSTNKTQNIKVVDSKQGNKEQKVTVAKTESPKNNVKEILQTGSSKIKTEPLPVIDFKTITKQLPTKNGTIFYGKEVTT